MRVLVLGGGGFIGRHTVHALSERGHNVIIGSRFAGEGRLQVRCHQTLSQEAWCDLISPFDVVVNCVGILRQRYGETYDAVHHRAPAALARACSSLRIRFVHVSALGLSANASSRFLRSKFAGEQAIKASGADYSIVRPSLLDGADGFGSCWLRRVANWPIHFASSDARGRIAAMDVDELGEAIAALVGMPDSDAHREVEVGGAELSLPELLRALRTRTGTPPLVRVPALIVRLIGHVCDVLHVTPLSWGHVELMRKDNCPAAAHAMLPELLARAPKIIGRCPPTAPRVARPDHSRVANV